MIKEKKCPDCNKVKSVTEFHKNKSKKDGLSYCCKPCELIRHKKYREKNRDKKRKWNRDYELRNKDKKAKNQKLYRERHKEKVAEIHHQHYLNNKEKHHANSAKYHAQKLQAVPPWLDDKMLKQIEDKYKEAIRLTEETGIPHEVDHIIPLRSETVCGLHVPWNLQVIPAKDNRSKSNRVEEEEVLYGEAA